MATYLGELSLRSADNSDLFHQHHMHASELNNDLIKSRLNSSECINGFNEDHLDIDLIDVDQEREMIPIQIEPGNETIKVIFKDAGEENYQYEVMVYLLIEEEEL